MGCHLSTANAISDQLDDSIHAMYMKQARLAKERGETPKFSYRPAAKHPLLHEDSCDSRTVTLETESACRSFREDMPEAEIQQLLFHTKNHCDTVDRRDIVVIGGN